MIKVFLVEDEVIIRKSIKNNVDWEGNGFIFAGEASDGEMALPLIQKLKPDIVITDIRMPFMDGLELSKILKKEMPDTIIIILSGYNEFDYAQKAIKLGVKEYLSKPVTAQQLLEALCEVKEKIMERNSIRENEKKMHQQTEEHKQTLRYQFLGELIRGKMPLSQLLDKGESLGIQLMASVYNFMLLQIFQKDDDTKKESTYKEFQKMVQMLVYDVIGDDSDIVVFQRATEGYVFMIKGDDSKQVQQRIEKYVEAFSERIRKEESMEFFIGIGREVERIHALSESYDSANEAFAYRYMSEKNRALFYEELEEIKAGGQKMDYNLEKVNVQRMNSDDLDKFLKNGELSDIAGFVTQYMQDVGEGNMDSLMFCQYILMNIQIIIVNFLETIGLQKEDLEEEFPEYQKQMMYISKGNMAADYIEKLIAAVLKLRNTRAVKKHISVIDEAKQFIEKNYRNENLSLNMVAGNVGLSTSHFSTVFKQEAGQTFVEYLTSVRMERAKELLRCSDMKASEISYEVGYKDPHYFSYLFKKTQSCTPREYRMRGV